LEAPNARKATAASTPEDEGLVGEFVLRGIGNWQCLILGFPPVCLASGGNLIGASFIVGKPDNYAPPITHRQNARGTAPKGELGIGKKV
jgi:hypothetical protein